MANWIKLKKAIADVIKTNGNQEITGAIMQQTLMSIVDNVGGNAQFGGVAVPSTVPADTDGTVFYLASTGTYPNFNNIEVDASEIAVFTKNTAGTWVKTSLPIQHPTIKKPLLIGGNVAAVTKGTGVVLSVPTLNADGTETASELSIEAATPANNGAMTKDQVNTLKEVDDFYTRMTDYVIGDNDDTALIDIESTRAGLNLKYKTLDIVNGSKKERTKAIPAVDPMNGGAGAADMDLIHDIPYFFDFYEIGFTSLSDGEEITKALIPKFQTNYDKLEDLYADVSAIQNKLFANPKAGDRILIGSLSRVPVVTTPLWATVTSAQLISGVYSVTVEYDGDNYIFAYTSSNDTAILRVPWTKICPKRNIYPDSIASLSSGLSETDIKGRLTPMAYQRYGIVYPIKPQTGDLMEEVMGDDESRFVTIIALRNKENPDEYTDIFIPLTGKDNRYTKVVLKNDFTSVQSSGKILFENYRRYYEEKQLLALDTVKAETIENSILDAYTPLIEELGATTAQIPKVGDLIKMQNDYVPVCEVISDDSGVQHTRWFSKGKLYEVLVNTALTRVPEDPKVIYNTTSGTLRDLYISAGAKYNEQTGYYELNGLTDITEEEMRVIYKYAGTPQTKAAFAYSKARTNLPMPGMYNGSVYGNMFYGCPNLEVAYLGNRQSSPTSYDIPLVYTEGNNCFYLCKKLKKIYGKIYQRNNNWDLTFGECLALEEVRIAELYSSIQLSWSPNLSKESVQYMITNAKPLSEAAVGSITITLHPTAYARLKDDADIVAALEAKGGIITLVSA